MIPELLSALPLTLAIMFLALIVGFGLALIATTFRVRRVPVISQVADLYVSYARSVPVVLQLFVAFYGLPVLAGLVGVPDFLSPTVASMVALSLYHGGYLSEVMRPAYLAVDRGQHDAADSLGYTFRQKITRVVGPQTVHIALPGYGNSLIYMIHNVALVMYIGAADVMATAHLIMERDYNQYQFETYLVLAVIYSLMCLIAWLIVRSFEHRSSMYAPKAGPVKTTLMAASDREVHQDMFDIDVLLPDLWEILGAVPVTLAMALTIFIFSTIIGSLFALVEHRQTPVLRQLVVAYKVAFKGVPMVVVIFLVYYSLPSIIHFLGGLVGLSLNGHATPNWVILVVSLIACVAAFQAEVVKGALNSFDSGQADAAHSLGYKNSQLFRRILFPQVVVAAIPDLANSFMVIMKALSLGFAIEVVDIFAQSQLTAALNFYYLEAFVIAVVIYMVMAYIVTQIADRTERALRVWT